MHCDGGAGPQTNASGGLVAAGITRGPVTPGSLEARRACVCEARGAQRALEVDPIRALAPAAPLGAHAKWAGGEAVPAGPSRRVSR